MQFRPLHHTFAPLGDSRQCRQALGQLLTPWTWRNGKGRTALRTALQKRYGGSAFVFHSGRESLLAILRSLRLSPDEEIIVQGYTCIVVPNAITAAGCVPVYVDIDRDSLNLNVEDVEKAITPKTRAVICQHTFGIPANTKALREVCDRHSLLLIEDCAHVMPDDKGPRQIAQYGDAMFFSFGRDKAVSGITGGAVIAKDDELAEMLTREEEKAALPGFFETAALLLYPLLYAIARPLYAMKAGKALLAVAGKTGLLRPIVTGGEKEGRMPARVRRLSDAFARLAASQLNRLEAINDHRRSLTALYLREGLARNWFKPDASGESPLPLEIDQDLPLQKFPFFVLNADAVRAKLRRKNIHLNDGWTNCVVCPSNASPAQAGYVPGSDPEAEAVCQKILSLPTHPGTSEKDALHLVKILDTMLKSSKRS